MTGGKEESLYGEQLSAGALVDGYAVERVHYRGPLATLYRARALRTRPGPGRAAGGGGQGSARRQKSKSGRDR